MKQEDKKLLLKVLCAILPYGVVIQQSPKYADKHFADKWEKEPHDFNIIGIIGKNILVTDKNTTERTYAKGIVSKPVTVCIYDELTKQTVRPYLRPMSSMTEVEKNIFDTMTRGYTIHQQTALFDWLNAHHFDYRGLIEKGLAIIAPDGMYK
jgi:hypothetical protein